MTRQRHEHGYWEDGDGNTGGTLMCCHCNAHFQVVVGSGTRRGFCTRCHAVTCGGEACMTCVPFQKVQDDLEAGKTITEGIFAGTSQKPFFPDPSDLPSEPLLYDMYGRPVE